MSGLLGSTTAPTNTPIEYSGLNVGTSQWNMPLPLFWGTRRLATNAMAFANFQGHQVNGKGGGKGGGKSAQQQTYTADVLLGLCEGPVDSIQNIWANGSTTTTTTLSALNMTFFPGTLGQAAWSYWQSQYPSLQQNYSQTAYLGAVNLALGESATIPQNDFECVRASMFAWTRTSTIAGWINPTYHTQASATDVLMSDVITDLLTNVQYGALLQSADLGSIAQYATYNRAQGIFVSPLLNTQEKCTDVLNRFAQITNSWIFWSGVQLEFYPLADAAITGNGVTFTPKNDVAYTLAITDLLAEKGQPPVKVTRKDPADCYNRTSVNICDRTLGYIDNPIPWVDDQLIDQFGLRDNTSISANEICDPQVGAIVAQLVGKRAAYIRNTYQFKTNWNFILCLPGTVLQIPLNYTGQTVRVRVTEVSEDDKGQLSFTAEEFPGTVGTYVPPQSQVTASASQVPNIYAAAPSINTPAIFEPPASFTGGVAKIIIAASGSGNWGGCTVNISFDGTTYVPIGTITAPAPQGVLTASLPAYGGANPDTTDTLAVDLTQSATTPQPVTNADAVALRTLALIAAQPTVSGGASVVPSNGELLAFGNTAITGTYTANLTYLERGQYGTTAGAHAAGAQFTLIDVLGNTGTSVAYTLPQQYIGQTIYLKLASFNLFDHGAQDLSSVVEYQYTPVGTGFGTGPSGVPATPTGLTGVASLFGYNALSWAANPTNDSVISYSLYKGEGSGAAFSSCVLLYQGVGLVYTDAAIVAGTTYTYYVVANNSVGQSAVSAACNITALANGNIASGLTALGSTTTTTSTSTFTLTSGVPSGASLVIVVNGSILSSSYYSISGTTVTFSPAIASGSTILAYYITSTGTGGGGGGGGGGGIGGAYNNGYGLK